MQTASDIFLGWQRVKDIDGQRRDYYIRQLHDWKGSAHVDTLRVPGAVTVRPDVRRHPGPGPRPFGRLDRHRRLPGQGRRSSTRPSPTSPSAYADQNERDYEQLVRAVKAGRIAAETGL